MVRGQLAADGIALVEILHADFSAGAANPKMRARLAYVKSDSGATLGFAEHANWSMSTIQALAALRAAMEEDLAKLYLVGAAVTPTTSGRGVIAAPQGIADHLGIDDAPSV